MFDAKGRCRLAQRPRGRTAEARRLAEHRAPSRASCATVESTGLNRGAALSNDVILLRAALVDCRLTLTAPVARDALASVAWLVNQHLALKEREALWALLENSRCGKPGVVERQWLRLHAAVGAADPTAMAEAAGAVLDGQSELPLELVVRALSARVAGLILTNQAPQAARASSPGRSATRRHPACSGAGRARGSGSAHAQIASCESDEIGDPIQGRAYLRILWGISHESRRLAWLGLQEVAVGQYFVARNQRVFN